MAVSTRTMSPIQYPWRMDAISMLHNFFQFLLLWDCLLLRLHRFDQKGSAQAVA